MGNNHHNALVESYSDDDDSGSVSDDDTDSRDCDLAWALVLEYARDVVGVDIGDLDLHEQGMAVDYVQANLHRYCPELLRLELEVPDSPLTGSIMWTLVNEHCESVGWDPGDLDQFQLREAVIFAQNNLGAELEEDLWFRSGCASDQDLDPNQDSDQDSDQDQDSSQNSDQDSDQDQDSSQNSDKDTDQDQDSNQNSDQDSGQDSDQDSVQARQ